jgi:hypothetical protein
MYVDRFCGMFSNFNITLGDGDFSNKNKQLQYFDDDNPSVFSHSMNTLVNFMRHITFINIVWLA